MPRAYPNLGLADMMSRSFELWFKRFPFVCFQIPRYGSEAASDLNLAFSMSIKLAEESQDLHAALCVMQCSIIEKWILDQQQSRKHTDLCCDR